MKKFLNYEGLTHLSERISDKFSLAGHNHEIRYDDLIDKPFHDAYNPVLIDEDLTFAYQSDEGIINANTTPRGIVEGKTYTLVYNGVSYTSVASSVSGYVMLGNLSILGINENTDLPFAYVEVASHNIAELMIYDATEADAGTKHVELVVGHTSGDTLIADDCTSTYPGYGVAYMVDVEITQEDLSSGFSITYSKNGIEKTVNQDNCAVVNDSESVTISDASENQVLVFLSKANGITATPSAILYDNQAIVENGDPIYIVHSLTISGYRGFVKALELKQLDEKFIPATIARDSEIPQIDTTLTVSDAAADAKATGDALKTKQPTITGAASSITTSNLTANTALISNSSGKVSTSSVTATELGYLSGVTSGVQSQITSVSQGLQLAMPGSLKWDGVVGNREYVTPSPNDPFMILVHVSDRVPSFTFGTSCMVGVTDNDNGGFSSDIIDATADENGAYIVNEGCIVVPSDNYELDGIILPKKGIYFMSYNYLAYGMDISLFFVSSLSILGENFPEECPLEDYFDTEVEVLPAQVIGNTITWNGVTDGHESLNLGIANAARLADCTLSYDELAAKTITGAVTLSDGSVVETTSPAFENFGNATLITMGTNANNEPIQCVVAHVDNASLDGITFPTAGFYFLNFANEYVSSFSISDYSFTLTRTNVNTYIKYEHLPEALQFGETSTLCGSATIVNGALTWDGNTSGLESLMLVGSGNNAGLYKVAESYPDVFDDAENTITGVVTLSDNSSCEFRMMGFIAESMGLDSVAGIYWAANGVENDMADMSIIVITTDAMGAALSDSASGSISGIFTKGVYLMATDNVHVESISLDGHEFKATSIKQIDPKYLPEATAIEVDPTLSISGAPADAKAVGDAIANIDVDITGAASTIKSANLTANRALVSNGSGKVAVSAVTSTELGYLDGVTSGIQSQLDGKVPTSRTVNGKALTGNISLSAADVGAATAVHTHTAADVGADASGTAQKVVSAHDSSDAAHSDMRSSLANIGSQISTLNETKVGIADIVNDLSTDAADKPLSAAQGLMLKEFIDNNKLSKESLTPVVGYSPDSSLRYLDTAASLPFSSCYDVTYGNGRFVAVFRNNTTTNSVAYSLDGISWLDSDMPIAKYWEGIAYGNGTFVAIASDYRGIAHSTDGAHWACVKLDGSENLVKSITYGNEKFIVGLSDRLFSSNDAMSWTELTIPEANFGHITYVNDRFIATRSDYHYSDYIYTSVDGVDWNQISMPAAKNWENIIYCDQTYLTVVYGITSLATTVIYSSDCINWSTMDVPSSVISGYISGWTSCYGNGTLIAIASSKNKCIRSIDNGATWTIHDFPITQNIYSVVYANNKFFAFAYDSSIAYSIDGITWETAFNGLMQSGIDVTNEVTNLITSNVSKEQLGLGNVENKSSATIRDEITSSNVSSALGYTPVNPTELTSHTGSTSNPHAVTKAQVGLSNVENKSSATIRGELTKTNVTDALGYTPPAQDTVYAHPTYTAKNSGLYKVAIDDTGHVSETTAVTKSDIIALGIPAQDTVYSHPNYTAKSSGLYKVTVDNTGHVSAATAVAKSDITGLGIPAQDTVYTHPTHTAKSSGLYKVTVDGSGHVSAATAVAKSDITALGIPAQDTTYSAAGSTLGLVKSGGDITISNGVITVNDDSHNHTISNIDNLQATIDTLTSSVGTKAESSAVEALSTTLETKVVMHTSQDLTDAQMSQARANIGAGTSDVSSWKELKDRPFGEDITYNSIGDTLHPTVISLDESYTSSYISTDGTSGEYYHYLVYDGDLSGVTSGMEYSVTYISSSDPNAAEYTSTGTISGTNGVLLYLGSYVYIYLDGAQSTYESIYAGISAPARPGMYITATLDSDSSAPTLEVRSLTINGFDFKEKSIETVQIEEKYIPEEAVIDTLVNNDLIESGTIVTNTFEWDGTTENHYTVIDGTSIMVLLAEAVLDATAFEVGDPVVSNIDGALVEDSVSSVMVVNDSVTMIITEQEMMFVLIHSTGDVLGSGANYEHTGVYFMMIDDSWTGNYIAQATGSNLNIEVDSYIVNENHIPSTIQRVGDDVILSSSTEGSTKKFKLTVDDTGTITAIEVT